MISLLRKFVLFSCIAFLLAACGSNLTVTSDWDTSVDFSKFKSVLILPDDNASTPMVDQRIRKAITDDLVSKGFVIVEDEAKADVAIAYTVTTEERSQFRTTNTGVGGYSMYHSPWNASMSASSSRTTESKFTVGTLIMAAFQREGKTQVWQGTASGRVRESTSPQQSEQNIREAVTEAMVSFPPMPQQ
ncbi:protein of unknown function [Alteromonadaceae bacterium Bs31]|nr:protein of unknown function [Alteromonadaceae bacterium Bs31]